MPVGCLCWRDAWGWAVLALSVGGECTNTHACTGYLFMRPGKGDRHCYKWTVCERMRKWGCESASATNGTALAPTGCLVQGGARAGRMLGAGWF